MGHQTDTEDSPRYVFKLSEEKLKFDREATPEMKAAILQVQKFIYKDTGILDDDVTDEMRDEYDRRQDHLEPDQQ